MNEYHYSIKPVATFERELVYGRFSILTRETPDDCNNQG